VPAALYHEEWERRRLRNVVHLTIGGCLGPCALANVVLLMFDGQALWFQSMNSAGLVYALYDYVEDMLDAERVLPPPPMLAPLQFTASAWQERPDGQPVEDRRPRRLRSAPRTPETCTVDHQVVERARPNELVARMDGAAAAPRRNGELVFEAPWQGRAFGMAVSLHEGDLYDWEEFRQRLIAEIAAAERRDEPFDYYACWLAAFESLLHDKGILAPDELDARTFEFEFGERDEVF
jgi:nitrile hydratase accessory protein